MNNIKVGDVVAWDKVPDGALVRYGDRYYVRLPDDRGWWVGATGRQWAVFGRGPAIPGEETAGRRERGWTWSWHNDNEPVAIVALGISGQESADDLRRLAEVFDVREALIIDALDQTVGVFLKNDGDRDLVIDHAWGARATPDIYNGFIVNTDALLARAAERLYAAGWRPGMTAEDAARLLSAC